MSFEIASFIARCTSPALPAPEPSRMSISNSRPITAAVRSTSCVAGENRAIRRVVTGSIPLGSCSSAGGIDPLHLIEDQDKRAGSRRQADVLRDFLEQTVLAPASFLDRAGNARIQPRELRPALRGRIRKAPQRLQHLRPYTIWRAHTGV